MGDARITCMTHMTRRCMDSHRPHTHAVSPVDKAIKVATPHTSVCAINPHLRLTRVHGRPLCSRAPCSWYRHPCGIANHARKSHNCQQLHASRQLNGQSCKNYMDVGASYSDEMTKLMEALVAAHEGGSPHALAVERTSELTNDAQSRLAARKRSARSPGANSRQN